MLWAAISPYASVVSNGLIPFYLIKFKNSRLLCLPNFRSPSKIHSSIAGYCGSTAESTARQMFDEMSQCDVVGATAMIGRAARDCRHEDAIYLFSKMLRLDTRPNEFTFGTVIPSSTALRNTDLGKQLHSLAAKMGLHANVFVGSALLDLYTKLSSIEEAQRAFEDTREPNVVSYTTLVCGLVKNERFCEALELFRMTPERNVVSWNAIIGGFSQIGQNELALNLFMEMIREGMLPNHATFPCVIASAGHIAALGMGRSFHACALKFLGQLDAFVGNSLISFYARCGSLEDSLLVFNKVVERSVVSWNALIWGYAHNGRPKEAGLFFKKMQEDGLQPNNVTFLGLLWACNHAGLVDEGLAYFNLAKLKYPYFLDSAHYACLVDLLSRSGRFSETERCLGGLPFDPGTGFWKALLGGCLIHSNFELGEYAAQRILALDPDDVSSYVMLSNAHSAAGRWQCVSVIRKEMRENGMKRVPGCSWIEIRGRIYTFVTRDQNHCQKDDVYMVLLVFIEHATSNRAYGSLTKSCNSCIVGYFDLF